MIRVTGALAVLTALAFTPATAATADEGHWRRAKLRWYQSVVVRDSRVVKIAVVLGAADSLPYAAKVRETPNTVRIGLWRRTWTGQVNAIAYHRCVRIRLRFRVGDRVRVDSSSDLAPDRGHGGSPAIRRLRKARGCDRLRVKYLPTWHHHEHWREER
jgi:hypothetical protein